MNLPQDTGDIIIVGGGPAGLTTALSLVHHAPALRERITIVEKARYPREKICAGGVGDRGWRFLEALDAAPSVPEVRIHGISVCSTEGICVARPGHIGRVIRRVELDAALAEIVEHRGIRIEQGVSVRDITEPDGEGALVHTRSGVRRACIVVGADGVGSAVRRSMGLHAGDYRALVLEVDTPGVAGDPDRDLIHFDASDRSYAGYIWDFPSIVDGEAVMCRGLYVLRPRTGLHPDVPVDDAIDLTATLGEYMAARGLDIGGVRKKRFAERGFAVRDRVTLGRRMLVGESAGIDPVSGEGIAQALEYGFRAGAFLAQVVQEGRPLDDWARVLPRSRLGWDLRVRTGIVPVFYGRWRPALERGFAASPKLLHAGAQHWGGRLPKAWDVARGMLQASRGVLRPRALLTGR